MCLRHYHMGGQDILLHRGPVTLLEDPATEIFLSDKPVGEKPIVLEAVEADLSFLEQWKTSVYTGGYELRHGEGKTFLLNHWMTQRFAYGVFLEELHGTEPLRIYCNKDCLQDLQIRPQHLMGSVGLHHRLLQRGAGILHASYIAYEGRAVLFAAPSQVGKSTQGELWRRYANARVINGDRAMLCPVEGRWHSGGSFSCGSSAICENETLPLGAIILLEQGSSNVIRPATVKEGIHSLLAGLETFHWDMGDVDLAIQTATRMAAEIPMLRYSCTAEESAVHTLREYLEVNVFHENL